MTRYKHVEVTKSRHGQRVVYFRRNKGPRIRLPDDMTSPLFIAAYEDAFSCTPTEDVRNMPVTPINLRRKRAEKVIRGAMRSARTRSRKKRVPFDLDVDFLLQEAAAQDFRCALTGIEFFAKNNTKSRVDPYTPSIDRIVPSLGYVKERPSRDLRRQRHDPRLGRTAFHPNREFLSLLGANKKCTIIARTFRQQPAPRKNINDHRRIKPPFP